MTNEFIFWTQVVTFLGYVISAFVLYRILVAQKDATIENLKIRLEDAENKSPDKLMDRLNKRIETLTGELDRTEGEKTEEIADKQRELADVKKVKEQIETEYKRLKELATEYFCPFCEAPLVDRGSASESVEYQGREVDVDHEWTSYECGYRLADGQVVGECKDRKQG